ncbi:MAG TPA: long-chain fatty acid--CoA ligase [Stellaceae bacterium]|nr:long-chain fatty acid--CoA ligase [Stellaceae bacterium]
MDLTQGLNRAATIAPSATATICGERRHSWAETRERILRIAGGLRRLGLAKGDRVAIVSLNNDRYFELMFAAPALGAIVVPVNTRLAPPEIAYILEDSGAKMLFVDDAFAALPGQLASLAAVGEIVHLGEGPTPAGMRPFEALLGEPAVLDDIVSDDVAGIFYTGGTTGRSKGVMLTHQNLIANAAMIIPVVGYRADSIYVHAPPMFHLADGASTFAVTMVGGVHVFIPRFDPADLLAAVARYRATNTLLVPTMINALASYSGIRDYDTSSLRVIPYGASPMPEAVLSKAVAALPGVRFLHVYGMTEAAPLVTAMELDPEPEGERLKSCGRPGLLVEVRIADLDDSEVPRGTVGEIQVRGPNVMLGYWNQPEVTRTALRGEWYHSGDGGYMDADGYVYVVDRLKDMIITGGENVYSAEVESAISTLDGVAEVAVIGIPDERWGEAVHAVVVPVSGRALTAEQVIAHCRTLIAGYKCPRSIEIRHTPLPLSGAGKVLKAQLREPLWAGHENRVS